MRRDGLLLRRRFRGRGRGRLGGVLLSSSEGELVMMGSSGVGFGWGLDGEVDAVWC